LIGDLIYGSTIHEVRHRATIPVLLVRAENK
jgi:nucleotide-binding universal stress UspA family protein